MISYEVGHIAWYAVTNLFLLAFILRFLKLRFPFKVSALIVGAVFLTISLLDYARYYFYPNSLSWEYTAITLVEIVLVQGSAIFLSAYRDGRSLFTGLVASNYVLPGYTLGAVVLASTGNYILTIATSAVCNIILFFVLDRFVMKEYFFLQGRGKTSWLSLCFIPVLFYLMFYFLTIVPFPLSARLDNVPAALIAIATMIVSYILVMRYMEKSATESDIAERRALLEGYAKSLSIEAGALEEAQKTLAIIKHDHRHYANMVSGMLEEKNYSGIQEIIGEVSRQIDRATIPHYCIDPALNAAISAIAIGASQQGVPIKTSILLPDSVVASHIEFAAVVANLVENAARAASEVEVGERFVDVRIRPIKNQLIVEVSNPFASSISVDKASGLPISQHGDSHGVGLQSVREFAERYEGAFDCTFEEGFFVARLLLPISDLEKSR